MILRKVRAGVFLRLIMKRNCGPVEGGRFAMVF